MREYRQFCTAFNCLNLTELRELYHWQLIEKQLGYVADFDSMEMDSSNVGTNVENNEDLGVKEMKADDGNKRETKKKQWWTRSSIDEICHVDRKKWVLQNCVIPIPLEEYYQLLVICIN